MEFPRPVMGAVIGKAGATIKGIRAQTQAAIAVDELPGGELCEFKIRGTPAAVDAAKAMILDVANNDRSAGGGRGGGGGGNHGDEWGRNGGKGYQQQAPTQEAVIELPLEMAGRIIGSRGSNIAEIRQQSGAHVSVDKLDNCCQVRISGTPEQIDVAQGMVRKTANFASERPPPPPPRAPSRLEDELQVPHSMMGKIIGKGGETVMQMQRDSGCKIDISKATPGIIRLSGTYEEIAIAKRIISDIVDQGMPGGYGMPVGKGGGDRYGGGGKPAPIQDTLSVDPSAVGRIIGRGGETINSLQRDSGAKIDIDKNSEGLVRISGPGDAVERAKRAIIDLLNSSESGGGGGGKGGRGGGGGGGPDRTENFEIPPDAVERIMEARPRVEMQTGARIGQSMENPCKVVISGSARAVQNAQSMLLDILERAELGGPPVMADISLPGSPAAPPAFPPMPFMPGKGLAPPMPPPEMMQMMMQKGGGKAEFMQMMQMMMMKGGPPRKEKKAKSSSSSSSSSSGGADDADDGLDGAGARRLMDNAPPKPSSAPSWGDWLGKGGAAPVLGNIGDDEI
ncbi:unnamed protein product [Prorocentrum cordatum]|uniref:K Homology domain-containing protein n=1 Tax=Prorocentrum cordatum TaxID=2364126 RepID=A0ABN9WAG5_9DINO|nr:unnamed protein product [Polarella glacialis]